LIIWIFRSNQAGLNLDLGLISNSLSIPAPADKKPTRNCKTHSSRLFQVSARYCMIHIRKKTGRTFPASALLSDIRIPDRLWLIFGSYQLK